LKNVGVVEAQSVLYHIEKGVSILFMGRKRKD